MYEELVKRLREATGWKNASEHYSLMKKAADAIEELKRDLDFAIRAEAAATEACKPRWIPTKERLPQEREWVLCQCHAKIRMVLRLQNGYWHQDSRHEFMSGFVTHWMPLPEPPKEAT